MRLKPQAVLSKGAKFRDVNFLPVALRLHPLIRDASSAKRNYPVRNKA